MLVSQHLTVINPCYPNQKSAETGSTQNVGSGGAWRWCQILRRISYVTGWAPVPARDPRQSLTCLRIIRWCLKSSHPFLVVLFVIHNICTVPIFYSHISYIAIRQWLSSPDSACILRYMLSDDEDVGFELLSASDTMRQPGLASDFFFFFFKKGGPLYFLISTFKLVLFHSLGLLHFYHLTWTSRWLASRIDLEMW